MTHLDTPTDEARIGHPLDLSDAALGRLMALVMAPATLEDDMLTIIGIAFDTHARLLTDRFASSEQIDEHVGRTVELLMAAAKHHRHGEIVRHGMLVVDSTLSTDQLDALVHPGGHGEPPETVRDALHDVCRTAVREWCNENSDVVL